MLRPVEMLKVNVLVLEKYLTPLTEALGAAGIVHLVDAVSQSRDKLLSDVNRGEDIRELERLIQRCRDLLEALDLSFHEPPAAASRPLSRTAIAAVIGRVETRLQAEDEAVAALISESGLLAREAAQLADYPFQKTRLAALRELTHLYIATGRLPPSVLPEVGEKLSARGVVVGSAPGHEAEGSIAVLSSRKDRWAVESELGKVGFKQTELPEELEGSAVDERWSVSARAEHLRQRIEDHKTTILAIRERHGDMLTNCYQRLRNALAIARAQQYFGKAAALYCISGWVPRSREPEVRRQVEETTRGTGIMEAIPAAADERVRAGLENVPVQFRDSAALRPFQQLVANFGAPRYNEVEPSLFVALSFVFMFGIMFGDIGQGALVALAGLYLVRTKRPALRGLRNSGPLLISCGLSATVFGFLYGSVFGYENARFLPPVWLSPLRDVARLLKMTVAVGIILISVGIVINIVNKIRARRYLESVLDKFGVIGVLFYWGSLGLGLKVARTGELSAKEIVLVVVLPLAILFLREPLTNLLRRQRRILHEDIFSFILEGSIEIMETVTTFLGSTVSFVRVGAFALSHAALCLAVYSVADVLRQVSGTGFWGGFWSLLVIALGNLLVILLEGMIVTIQGIRLQYYELFSKYFAGDGVLYTPFQLAERENRKED